MVNPLAHATAHQGATERVSPRPIEPEQPEQLDDLLGVYVDVFSEAARP
jgi:hypothetical protein